MRHGARYDAASFQAVFESIPMSNQAKVKPRLPRGFGDRKPAEIAATNAMIEKIRAVYERYGFEAVETPFFEFTEALGKFLPDTDRPNEGVFSLQDEDEQWLSLRYDLTAPLARYVAENYDGLPKPYRSYRQGYVFRNEKPGPGRFRQFMQFDADTVGSGSIMADAEMCVMAADCMEAVGIKRGDYVIKVNNRKVLDGVMEAIGLGGPENAGRRLTVLRAIDKYDRLGFDGVMDLLRSGRKDASGDFTVGAGLSTEKASSIIKAVDTFMDIVGENTSNKEEIRSDIIQALRKLDNAGPKANTALVWAKSDFPKTEELEKLANDKEIIQLISYFRTRYFENNEDLQSAAVNNKEIPPFKRVWDDDSFPSDAMTLSAWRSAVGKSPIGNEGISELESLCRLVRSAGYGPGRIMLDSSVVRGLEYYTGPVFEAELTFTVPDEKGQPIRFGSVGGGGRYDGLVSRFRDEPVPATGFSVGVSRLQAALAALDKDQPAFHRGPVVVLVMDKDAEAIANYQRFVGQLRFADIPAEMYLGSAGMNAQLKYADKRKSVVAIIQGSNERAQGTLVVKDLIAGAELASASKTMEREAYLALKDKAQLTVAEDRSSSRRCARS